MKLTSSGVIFVHDSLNEKLADNADCMSLPDPQQLIAEILSPAAPIDQVRRSHQAGARQALQELAKVEGLATDLLACEILPLILGVYIGILPDIGEALPPIHGIFATLRSELAQCLPANSNAIALLKDSRICLDSLEQSALLDLYRLKGLETLQAMTNAAIDDAWVIREDGFLDAVPDLVGHRIGSEAAPTLLDLGLTDMHLPTEQALLDEVMGEAIPLDPGRQFRKGIVRPWITALVAIKAEMFYPMYLLLFGAIAGYYYRGQPNPELGEPAFVNDLYAELKDKVQQCSGQPEVIQDILKQVSLLEQSQLPDGLKFVGLNCLQDFINGMIKLKTIEAPDKAFSVVPGIVF